MSSNGDKGKSRLEISTDEEGNHEALLTGNHEALLTIFLENDFEYEGIRNHAQRVRDADHPSIASSKKSNNSRKYSDASPTRQSSSRDSSKQKIKKRGSKNDLDSPPVPDELPLGSDEIENGNSDDATSHKIAIDNPFAPHTRKESSTSLKSARKGKKKGEGVSGISILEDGELSCEPKSSTSRTGQLQYSSQSDRIRIKSVQISRKSLQLNSDGTTNISQTKIEVPVVIQNDLKKPSAYKRLSNFDMFAPAENLPTIVLDTLSNTVENDLPPPGFERNRNVRRTSQQLPQVLFVTPQNSELVMKPNLIMTPLDTAHRLQLVKGANHSRGYSRSQIMDDEFESPIRVHSVAEGKKVKKRAMRKSAVIKSRRCNNCISTTWWIFLTFLVFLISCMAMQLGEVGKLVYPFDSAGTQCGVDGLSEMTALYYFNMTSVRAYKRCVETCPDSVTPICK